MMNWILILHKDGEDISRFVVGENGLTLGRASTSDVILVDSMASRHHAHVSVENDRLYVTDLGSRNGVLINGERVKRHRLAVNDEFVIGVHTFRVVCDSESAKIGDTGSMISYEKVGEIFERMVTREGGKQLPVLYRAAELLGTVFDLDELLQRILGLIADSLPVRRGYVITLSPDGKEPLVRASRSSEGEADAPPLSNTLMEHVFDLRNAVLTLDAQDDERFQSSDSIVRHRIRAAMCVPLCGRQDVIGAIYVDAGDETGAFHTHELELLSAIARVVGVAVENAYLYQESIEHARLAAIGQATASLGHWIKNVLTGIHGGGEFVDLGVERKDWAKLERGWGLVRGGLSRLEGVVLDLLEFSKERVPERTLTNIDLLVTEVVEQTRSRAEKVGVTLAFEAGQANNIAVDGRQIHRVLMNLLNNAVDACEEKGGAITVSTWQDGSGCYIRVKDTGVGIPEEQMAALFQAFSSTKQSRGTGLGLACSEKVVREHGGHIQVETQVGEGTSFTVFLPAQTIGPVGNHGSP